MDSTTQSGNYVALGGFILLILSKLGINTTIDVILTIIGGLVGLIGIIKQAIDHRNLGQALRASRGGPEYIE